MSERRPKASRVALRLLRVKAMALAEWRVLAVVESREMRRGW